MNTIIRISSCIVCLGCLVGLCICNVALADQTVPSHLVTGHGGVSVACTGGQWNLNVTDATSGSPIGYAADEALFHLNNNTAVDTDTIPSSCYDWLGTTSGQTIYVVPQTQVADTAYFGFNNREMAQSDIDALATWESSDFRVNRMYQTAEGKWIRIDLLSVTGLDGAPAPGEFSLWSTDDEGTVVLMSTAETPTEGNSFYLDAVSGHYHLGWGFTEPGIYEIEFQASTYLASEPETLITSPATTYYFGVLSVPEPSMFAMALGMIVAGALGTRRHNRRD